MITVFRENLIKLPKAQTGHRNAHFGGSLGKTQLESHSAYSKLLAYRLGRFRGLFGLCTSQNGFWREFQIFPNGVPFHLTWDAAIKLPATEPMQPKPHLRSKLFESKPGLFSPDHE